MVGNQGMASLCKSHKVVVKGSARAGSYPRWGVLFQDHVFVGRIQFFTAVELMETEGEYLLPFGSLLRAPLMRSTLLRIVFIWLTQSQVINNYGGSIPLNHRFYLHKDIIPEGRDHGGHLGILPTIDRVVREWLSTKVTFGQRPEGKKSGTALYKVCGKNTPTYAKALWLEFVYSRNTRRPVELEANEWGETLYEVRSKRKTM